MRVNRNISEFSSILIKCCSTSLESHYSPLIGFREGMYIFLRQLKDEENYSVIRFVEFYMQTRVKIFIIPWLPLHYMILKQKLCTSHDNFFGSKHKVFVCNFLIKSTQAKDKQHNDLKNISLPIVFQHIFYSFTCLGACNIHFQTAVSIPWLVIQPAMFQNMMTMYERTLLIF